LSVTTLARCCRAGSTHGSTHRGCGKQLLRHRQPLWPVLSQPAPDVVERAAHVFNCANADEDVVAGGAGYPGGRGVSDGWEKERARRHGQGAVLLTATSSVSTCVAQECSAGPGPWPFFLRRLRELHARVDGKAQGGRKIAADARGRRTGSVVVGVKSQVWLPVASKRASAYCWHVRGRPTSVRRLAPPAPGQQHSGLRLAGSAVLAPTLPSARVWRSHTPDSPPAVATCAAAILADAVGCHRAAPPIFRRVSRYGACMVAFGCVEGRVAFPDGKNRKMQRAEV
jgi:hypothetical protein